MATRKIKRTSCGFCMTNNDSRHRNCPGSIPGAAGGTAWVCWCSENGHPEPEALPDAPVITVVTDDQEAPAEPAGEPRTPRDEPKGTSQPKTPKELTPRCGAMTGRGPCKRRAGHTAGHDGR